MRVLKIITACLFVLCFPLLLLSSNLRCEVSAISLYEYGFSKYGISEVTGLENSDLTRAAKGLIDYFNNSKESAQIQVLKDGQEIDLFSQREIDHLKDVKELIQTFYRVQWITLAYMLIYVITGFIARKRAFLPSMMQGLFFGSIFTLGLFVIVGMWALIDFDGLFLNFHLTSFRNDLWQLPSNSYLIMMFPEGFFLDAALFLVGGTVVEALLLGAGAWVYRRRSG